MDISNIIAEYGAYYLKSGQNTKRVKQLMLQPAVTPGYMTPIKTDETIYQLANSSITSLVQGFQSGWTPKGSVKVIPNEIKLRKIKIDFEDYPDALEATWLGFLASDNVNRKEWPFVKWLIETHIIPKMKEEMELEAYGKGVYSAPTSGTANSASDAIDGLKTIVQAGVDSDGTTAGVINHIADVGDLDASTIFDQVESFIDGISNTYKTKKMNLFLPYEMELAYLRDKRSKGFYTISSAQGIHKGVDFTPQQIVGLPSLAGESWMFATPKENMLFCTKKKSNQTNFKIEESKRQVFLMCDWYEGMGFGINDAVWTTLDKTSE
jgi:hypothetical protein